MLKSRHACLFDYQLWPAWNTMKLYIEKRTCLQFGYILKKGSYSLSLLELLFIIIAGERRDCTKQWLIQVRQVDRAEDMVLFLHIWGFCSHYHIVSSATFTAQNRTFYTWKAYPSIKSLLRSCFEDLFQVSSCKQYEWISSDPSPHPSCSELSSSERIPFYEAMNVEVNMQRTDAPTHRLVTHPLLSISNNTSNGDFEWTNHPNETPEWKRKSMDMPQDTRWAISNQAVEDERDKGDRGIEKFVIFSKKARYKFSPNWVLLFERWRQLVKYW